MLVIIKRNSHACFHINLFSIFLISVLCAVSSSYRDFIPVQKTPCVANGIFKMLFVLHIISCYFLLHRG